MLAALMALSKRPKSLPAKPISPEEGMARARMFSIEMTRPGPEAAPAASCEAFFKNVAKSSPGGSFFSDALASSKGEAGVNWYIFIGSSPSLAMVCAQKPEVDFKYITPDENKPAAEYIFALK